MNGSSKVIPIFYLLVSNFLLQATASAASFQGIGLLERNPEDPPASVASAVSGDGRYGVGHSATTASHSIGPTIGTLIRWSAEGGLGNHAFESLRATRPPFFAPHALFDGKYIAATINSPPYIGYRLNKNMGVFNIMGLQSIADVISATSDDGSIIAGSDLEMPTRAGAYREQNGFAYDLLGFEHQTKRRLLTSDHGNNLNAWDHVQTVDISSDGSKFTGNGFHADRPREGVGAYESRASI